MDPPQEQPIPHPASTIMTEPLPHLPMELKRQIIEEAVTFPDGLRSDRRHGDEQDLVNKLSILNHQMSSVVSESLYKANTVIIKPQTKRPDGTTIEGPEIESFGYLAPFPGTPPSNIRPYITYPTIAQSQHVEELEFHFDVMGAGFYPTYYIGDQVEWLQKLASGELGFPKLKSLRIVFDNMRLSKAAVSMATRICPPDYPVVQFSTKDLAVVVGGRCCSPETCTHRWQCECARHRGTEKYMCELTQFAHCSVCWTLSETFTTAPSHG